MALVFGVVVLGWVIAGLACLAVMTLAIVQIVERILGRPGRFLAGDAQFLRDIGIRL
ncbi:MAG TPA: hypothetical protein VGF16_04915 [Bryobacteraceae bacterium]